MSDTGQKPENASSEPQAFGEVTLFLMSEERGAGLAIQYGPAGVPAVEELLALFGTAEGDFFSINPVQVASLDLKAALENLVSRHASAVPHLHRLKKLVSDLSNDTHFLLLPARPESTKETPQSRVVFASAKDSLPKACISKMIGPFMHGKLSRAAMMSKL